MLLVTLNVLFVLVAIAMIALIMQRGAGAPPARASVVAPATVFGARVGQLPDQGHQVARDRVLRDYAVHGWYATRQITDDGRPTWA